MSNRIKRSVATESQTPVEEAISKGKLYNPLTGLELLEVLIKRIRELLQSRPTEIEPALALEIEAGARKHFTKNTNLNTDVICYPKADVALAIRIDNRLPNDLDTNAMAVVAFTVKEFPQEENRSFTDFIVIKTTIEWNKPTVKLAVEWNVDEIPPDATRILNDLPVPTPTLKPGSGPNGESTYVDELKPASEKQKEAVVKQFGNQPTQQKGKK